MGQGAQLSLSTLLLMFLRGMFSRFGGILETCFRSGLFFVFGVVAGGFVVGFVGVWRPRAVLRIRGILSGKAEFRFVITAAVPVHTGHFCILSIFDGGLRLACVELT